MDEKVMGFVARFRNDLKFKGMDEYVGGETEGLLTDDISKAWIFETVAVARNYHTAILKGVTPKGHLEIDFPRVVKHTQVVVEIVREG